MAVTSIWSIKGWIGKVINYAENPDKTKENNEGRISENQSRSTQGLNDVITYAVNGVLYCAVRNPRGSSDGLVDVIVKEEDAPRINRIVDRFQFASVTEAAKIKTEIERTRAEKAKAGKSEKQEKKPEKVQVQQEKQGQAEPEKDYPQKSKEDQLMDELFGESVKKEGKEQNPSLAKTTKSRLSEPTSKKQEKTAEGTSKLFTPEKPEKPSVRKELREIQNARKKEAERRENRNDPVRNQGNKDRNQIRHQQPQQKRKPRKER